MSVLFKTLTDYVECLTVAGPVLLHGRGKNVLMPSGLSLSKQKRPDRAHTPEIGFCKEKNRLRDQFLKAIQEMIVLQDRQMHAVLPF